MTWVLAALAFAAYAWGAAAGVEWLDAGELTAAAAGLGVSHSPGQAAYTLVGHLASLLPVGEVAFRLNLLSAAAAAATVAGTGALARALLPRDDIASRIGAALAAVLVAVSPLTVEQATRAEVYAPLAALVVWSAVGVVRFARGGGGLLGAAFALALAAGVQPLIAAAAALPLAAGALIAAPRRAARFLPAVLLLGALGLAVNLYLYLRAVAEAPPILLWGDPSTPRGLLDVLTGRAYGQNFDAAGLGGRLFGHILLLSEGSGMAALLLGGAGLAFGAVTRLRAAGTLLAVPVVVVAATAAQRVFYPDNPDIHGYLLAALPFLAAGVAVAVAAVGRVIAHPAGLVVALAPAAFLCFAGPRRHVFPAWRPDVDTLRYHDVTVGGMPPGPALYVTTSDHGLFTGLYERLVAGDRPDVAIGNDFLCTSSWFLRLIDRQRPELFVPYLDDGGRKDRLLARLVDENRRAGRSVWVERPLFGERPVTHFWSFAPGGTGGARPELQFGGEIGRRIAGEAELHFLRWKLGRSLLDELPGATPVFIYEPWQRRLIEMVSDQSLSFGRPREPVHEVQLLHAWQLVLAGQPADRELDALGPAARAVTARMLLGRKREADAIRVLEPAVSEAGAALMLAAIHGNAGRLDAAAAILDQVLTREPQHARALAQRGLVRAKQGRMEEAERDLEASLAIDPAQPDVADYLEKLRRR